MKNILLPLCLLSLLYACSQNQEEWEVIPGKSAGPIRENTSEKELKELFGKENVQRRKIYIGQGIFLNGHILFEGERNECELLWSEDLEPPIDRLIFSHDGGSWHLKNGVAVGTSLDELNEKNGRPFVFYGFNWDMGGMVTSWENGEMNSIANDSLVLYIEPSKKSQKLPNDVLGDREISSDNPALADLNLKISKMEVLLQSSKAKHGIIIAKSGLVLRDSPSLEGLRQASIPFDAEVEIIDTNGPMATINDITAHWFKVRYRQYEGWVFGGYVDLIE